MFPSGGAIFFAGTTSAGDYKKVTTLSRSGAAIVSNNPLAAGIHQLRVRLATQSRNEESDEQLLHAFTTRRDEDAFAVLVRRHGPMVLNVCRRVLEQHQDAEDAFQATFLLLAHGASGLRKRAALASFLHGAAYRIALTAKRSASRRRKHEERTPARPPFDPVDELSWREVRTLLDEEIARLPEKYRTVFVLCCLEDLSQAEAARRLRMKQRTLSSRLASARKRLGQRLARRGVEMATVLAAATLATSRASALPAGLMTTTIKAALATLTGERLTGVTCASVVDLVESATSTMMVSKTKFVAMILLALTMVAGAGAWTFSANGLPLTAEMPVEQAESRSKPSQERKTQGPQSKDKSVAVSGQVFDPDGKPLRGAKVYYELFRVSSAPGPEAREVRATSTADGRFRFQMPQSELDKLEPDTSWDHVTVIAVAPGYGPVWTSFSTPEEAARLKLQLVKDDVPINCRVLDLEGRPIAGVTARVTAVFPVEGGLQAWIKTVQATKNRWNDTGEALNLDVPALPQLEAITDKDGRFRLAGIGRDRIVQLSLRGPTIAASPEDTFVLTCNTKPFSIPRDLMHSGLGQVNYYGATADIVAAPTKPLFGTIRDKDTGKPIAGATIRGEPILETDAAVQGLLTLQTTSDREGHYRPVGMPKGERNDVYAVPPAGQPYFNSVKRAANTLGLDPVRVDFGLKRGVWIRGRVTDKMTGKPIRARVVYGVFQDNPYLRGVPGYDGSASAVTGDDGSFVVLGLPGRGLLAVKADEDRYLHSSGTDRINAADKTFTNIEFIQTNPPFVSVEHHAFVQVTPPDNSKDVVCDVQLDSGKTAQGAIVGPDGKPVDGVRMMDLKMMWSRPQPLTGSRFTATALDLLRPRSFYFYHPGKRLGASVVLRGDEEQPVTVKLQPCGCVTGRLVGAKGQPCQDWPIYGRSEDSYMSISTSRWWQLYVSGRTDKQGRFRIDLIPGVQYHIHVVPAVPYTLKPGETKDLGEMKIE
jgi:RNA polymerase sigma factor (sigma-70 family)